MTIFAPLYAEQTLETLSGLHQSFVNYLPNLISFTLVLVIGSVITWLLAKLALLICEKMGLQHAAEQSGLAESMRDAGIVRTLPQIVGQVVFWLLMALTLMLAVKQLNIKDFDTTIQQILAFFPRLIVSLLILVLGLLLGKFLRGVIATGADRMGLNYAQTLANVVYIAFVIVLLHQISRQLGLDFDLFTYLILIAFAGLMLGLGLAIGLGGKDVISGILAGYYVRKRFQAGDRVSIGEIAGTIRDVGPVSTVVDDGGTQRIIPNTKMLHEAVR
jgi:small-conductance mechanosensitive channel